MTDSLTLVTCAGGAPWEAPLVRGLQRRELGVELVRRCVDHGELLGVALRDRPRVAVIAAELPWLDRDLVGTLHDHGVTVVAIEAVGSLRPLDRIGVSHRLPAGTGAEEVAALLHQIGGAAHHSVALGPPPTADAEPGRARGRMLAVWGSPGAPGRTTVAVHLALEAARQGVRTLLIDGDAWSATIAQLLGLEEAPSVAQAARLGAGGWPQPIESCLQAGPFGCSVLPGLARSELWPEVREHAWRAVLDAAAAVADLVVVDLAAPIEEDEELAFDRVPYRRNLMTIGVLEAADDVALVAAGDPVGVRRAIVAHRTLLEARPAVAPRVAVLVNRAPKAARRLQDCSTLLADWTGTPPLALLPMEPQLERVPWEGRPLHAIAPRSAWLKELRTLVAAVVHP